jgi:hypothetical protein
MANDDGRKPEGAPERSPKAGVGAPSGVDGNGPKQFASPGRAGVLAQPQAGARRDHRSRGGSNGTGALHCVGLEVTHGCPGQRSGN